VPWCVSSSNQGEMLSPTVSEVTPKDDSEWTKTRASINRQIVGKLCLV
jgi:hypothetical protein